MMKFRKTGLAAAVALALGALSLGGCVVYPSGYAYNGYYGPSYAPAYVAPPVYGSVFIGGGWGGGWHHWR